MGRKLADFLCLEATVGNDIIDLLFILSPVRVHLTFGQSLVTLDHDAFASLSR